MKMSLIQKMHPDKTQGYEIEFTQMKHCKAWLKLGIPLPTGKPPNKAE